MIKLNIKVGDTILLGKFRNKKVLVKSIKYNELGLPTVNGKNIVSFRYWKDPKVEAIRLKEVLGTIKEVKSKGLFIIDFDDTIAKVKANIYIRNGNKKLKLTPAEFAVYDPKPNDKFNFSEFNAVIKTAIPIQSNIKLLKRAAANPSMKVTILTARLLGYPVKRYLKTKFNLDIYVVAVGDADPQRKADYIEKEIKKGYDNIVFIDDSIKNVTAVKALNKKYPKINLDVVHTTEAEHIKFT